LDLKHEKHAVINPGNMCPPFGAVMAFLGIKGSMPLVHGSQGCSTYMRFQLTRHFREPVNIASSSLNEATVVYGGEENLLKALNTVEDQYGPDVIGVLSGCLTETIGDDLELIVKKYRERVSSEIVTVQTPGFKGTHIEGYDTAVYSILRDLTEVGEPGGSINVIPGILSPADTFEIRRIFEEMGAMPLMITDNSESLDEPFTGETFFITENGTDINEIRNAAGSMATISFSENDAGKFLERRYGVNDTVTGLPVGLERTDRLLDRISEISGLEAPPTLMRERGRLIDAMIDSHQYTYGRRVAIFADPAYALSMASAVLEMGMVPSAVFTGASSPDLHRIMALLQERYGFKATVKDKADIFDLELHLRKRPADLLIGNSYCSRVAHKFGIPLFRMGFPVYDRVGAQRIVLAGYRGGINFVDSLTNIILQFYYDQDGYERRD